MKYVKKLEINENPPLISYVHSAYESAIMASDAVSGSCVVEYSINDDLSLWKSVELNGWLEVGSTVKAHSDMKHETGCTVQYRPLNEIDQVIVKILSMRQLCAWESISLVLYDEEPNTTEKISEVMLRYGCPCVAKLFVDLNHTFLDLSCKKRALIFPFYIKLSRRGAKLNLQYSQNGKEWVDLYKDNLPGKCNVTQIYIGVMTEIKNEYLNWLSQNYIQLFMKRFDPNEIYIDYYLGATKNYQPFVTTHYLDIYNEDYDYEIYDKNKWFELVESRIDHKIYIVADIDHYYIKETEYYNKKHRFHQVLIYGVNIKKKTYYVLGYGLKNAMVNYEMSKNVLWKSLSHEGIRLICCRVNIDENAYPFNPVIIVKRLREYLNGQNSSEDISDSFPKMLNDKWGIDVYRSILQNESELYIFCHNSRLSYFFYEHKKLMLERFDYIQTKVTIPESITKEIRSCLEKNLNDSLIVKNMILMNIYNTNRKNLMTNVKKYLQTIVDNEEKAYNLLCDILSTEFE